MDRERFRSLWARCRTDHSRDGADRVFDVLHGHYSEPGRHYHTPEHIRHCLRQFDTAAARMDEPDAVEMALWFHDAIYVTAADDNELRSAELFEAMARESMPDGFCRRVHDLIMITAHRELPSSLDECFIVDIDLSSFGLPWAECQRDTAAVRAEFGHIADSEFYPKQRAFMQRLLARPTFCFTEFFREKHESRARENLRRTIETIDESGAAS